MTDRIHSYPKVWNLGHPSIDRLFEGPVVVEEKVDGSQFSFMRRGDEVVFRSKNCQVFPGSAGMFEPGVQEVLARQSYLEEGWIYRGEYLAKPKHNTLRYERTPERLIAIWDIETGPNRFLDPIDKDYECAQIGFECVPMIFSGAVLDIGAILKFLDRVSFLGGSKVEGLVFKNYSVFGTDGKILAGKHVCEVFKETNRKTHKKTTSADIKQTMAEFVLTEARFAKARQRMRDAGTLTDTPKDIGPLLKEIQQDVEAECAAELKEMLWRWARKDVLRASTRGFAEWYKQKLAEQQFTNHTTLSD